MYILTLAYQVYKHIKILCSIYLNLSFKLPQTFFTYENYVLSMLPRFQLRMLSLIPSDSYHSYIQMQDRSI